MSNRCSMIGNCPKLLDQRDHYFCSHCSTSIGFHPSNNRCNMQIMCLLEIFREKTDEKFSLKFTHPYELNNFLNLLLISFTSPDFPPYSAGNKSFGMNLYNVSDSGLWK